jgi:hypothetical protein
VLHRKRTSCRRGAISEAHRPISNDLLSGKICVNLATVAVVRHPARQEKRGEKKRWLAQNPDLPDHAVRRDG